MCAIVLTRSVTMQVQFLSTPPQSKSSALILSLVLNARQNGVTHSNENPSAWWSCSQMSFPPLTRTSPTIWERSSSLSLALHVELWSRKAAAASIWSAPSASSSSAGHAWVAFNATDTKMGMTNTAGWPLERTQASMWWLLWWYSWNWAPSLCPSSPTINCRLTSSSTLSQIRQRQTLSTSSEPSSRI